MALTIVSITTAYYIAFSLFCDLLPAVSGFALSSPVTLLEWTGVSPVRNHRLQEVPLWRNVPLDQAPIPDAAPVCNHPSRAEIDRDLVNGVPFRTLAAAHNVSSSALFRHTRHIREQQMAEQRQVEQRQVTQFLENLELLEFRLNRLYHKAEDSHSLYVSLGCLTGIPPFSLSERESPPLPGRTALW